MPSSDLCKFRLRLTKLEDRCTPAIMVDTTVWDPLLDGSLPFAIATANAANGQDTIQFDWGELGDTPVFTVPADEGVEVTDGVIIIAGSGNVYAKFSGSTPFFFTHNKEEGSTESVINGGVFDGCSGLDSAHGGAIALTGGTLSLNYNRFIDNTADFGGAVSVASGATLLVGAAQGMPPQPDDYPEVIGSSAVLFKGNTATAAGGAIQNAGGVVKIQRAYFGGNKAVVSNGRDQRHRRRESRRRPYGDHYPAATSPRSWRRRTWRDYDGNAAWRVRGAILPQ